MFTDLNLREDQRNLKIGQFIEWHEEAEILGFIFKEVLSSDKSELDVLNDLKDFDGGFRVCFWANDLNGDLYSECFEGSAYECVFYALEVSRCNILIDFDSGHMVLVKTSIRFKFYKKNKQE